MQHIRQIRPSDASGDVPVRRWKRLKRRVDELPEPELFGLDDGAPVVPFSSSQCEVYNTLDSMDCLLDAVKVADFMGDDEKMTMLATAAMTRCDFCLSCVHYQPSGTRARSSMEILIIFSVEGLMDPSVAVRWGRLG